MNTLKEETVTSRDKIEVQQLKLTSDQMKAALQRATENVRKMPVWNDSKTELEKGQDKK